MTIGPSTGIVEGVTEDKGRPWGEWLQQRREELGISLEQAEEETRIRQRYLEALEAGDLAALPDPIVGRGFLRNYAVYLELDPEEAAKRYPELLALPRSESIQVDESSPFVSEPFRPVPLHEVDRGRSRRWIFFIGAAIVIIVALALLGWWSYPRLSGLLARDDGTATSAAETPTRQSPSANPGTATYTPTATQSPTTTPASTGTVMVTPTPTITLTPTTTTTPSPSPTPSPPVYTGVFLELVFTDTSWIQVTVDGVRQFQGELEADTYRSWYGEQRIELRIGNAGAVLVTVNGQLQGTLGEPGEVVDRVFEKVDEGITEATITPVVTGQATTEPSETPTEGPTGAPAAPTFTATDTITPTATITPTTTP